ncbi:MAG: lysophospholipase [Cellulosilyticaceae bacterium]
MKPETFYMTTKDGFKIYVYKWLPDETMHCKGIVQIAHGMAEMASRYEEFARYLNKHGYIVYINDHRGHGKSAPSIEKIGYLGEKNGFEKLVCDMYELTKLIKEEYKELPIFLFSHSMGSFAAQQYIMHYGEKIDGAILSGTNGKQGILLDIGLLVAKNEVKKNGRYEPSPKLHLLIFGRYNKKIKKLRTNFDWLTRDEKEVDEYIANKYCGTIFPTSFFEDFITDLKYIQKPSNINKIHKDLPIYIFAGDKDPVGNYGKGIKTLYETYKNAGIKNIAYKIYEEGRHEMLHEINRAEVMKDIVNWLDDKIK